MTVHAYTSFTYSYLNRARVLYQTLRQQHPDWVLWAVITDLPPAGVDQSEVLAGFDHILTVTDLFPVNTGTWLFGHDIVEACTAVKGRAMQHILARPDCDKLVYFDPDIAVFNPMTPVIDLLDDYAIVLTPHQTEPDAAAYRVAIRDNEIASLHYGIFNLGFIAVANTQEANRFADWWAERLEDWCHDRLDQGLFVDQKWCNLVPCYFDGVCILRDPGYNVASWNLSQRKLRFDANGSALINNHLLRFYHFTKLGPVGDVMTQRYARDNMEIYELWWWYRHAVHAQTDDRIPQGWWVYGCFDNGMPITKDLRVLYRERSDLQSAFPDPFQTGQGSFFEWLKLPIPEAMEQPALTISADPIETGAQHLSSLQSAVQP